MTGTATVLYDGPCGFCQRAVRFISRRDPHRRFTFLPLQSTEAKALLTAQQMPSDPETIVLLEDGHAYIRSTAALRIARHLTGAWPLLSVFLLIPTFLRDAVYRLVARMRYRLYGRDDTCTIAIR